VLFNVPNAPAAQISMMLGLHGASYGVTGACATFGLALKQAADAISAGAVDAAIVGAVEATPAPEIVAAFHGARVAAMGPRSVPLTGLRGIHIAGGACVWVLVAGDVTASAELPDLGVTTLGVGISNDAEHIITPSATGPLVAIHAALASSGLSAHELDLWDLHATGTPGDTNEAALLDAFLPKHVPLSARKGLFGHGMSAGGGWELTAQTLGLEWIDGHATAPACGIEDAHIHPDIRASGRPIIADRRWTSPAPVSRVVCGKLSLGVGGVSSCVITEVVNRSA
jgi:3-oxoacyl-(acyl-carrier-protein) synthase